jgi:hypothetical protein
MMPYTSGTLVLPRVACEVRDQQRKHKVERLQIADLPFAHQSYDQEYQNIQYHRAQKQCQHVVASRY